MSLPLAASVSGAPQIQASGGGVGELVAPTVSPALAVADGSADAAGFGRRDWARRTRRRDRSRFGSDAEEGEHDQDERAPPRGRPGRCGLRIHGADGSAESPAQCADGLDRLRSPTAGRWRCRAGDRLRRLGLDLPRHRGHGPDPAPARRGGRALSRPASSSSPRSSCGTASGDGRSSGPAGAQWGSAIVIGSLLLLGGNGGCCARRAADRDRDCRPRRRHLPDLDGAVRGHRRARAAEPVHHRGPAWPASRGGDPGRPARGQSGDRPTRARAGGRGGHLVVHRLGVLDARDHGRVPVPGAGLADAGRRPRHAHGWDRARRARRRESGRVLDQFARGARVPDPVRVAGGVHGLCLAA